MAEGRDIVGKTLDQLEKEITCAVCYDIYYEPKILPCGHYYCKQCVLKIVLRTGASQPFSCPECRKLVTLPQGDVDNLLTAFSANRLKDAYTTLRREAAEAKQQQLAALTTTTDENCSAHNMPFKLFCFSCSTLICYQCATEHHKNHKYESCKDATPRAKIELGETLAHLKTRNERLSSALKKIQKTEEEMDMQIDSVANKISTSFEELHMILERYKQDLLEEAKEKAESKATKLSQQKEEIFSLRAEIQSIIDYTEQCMDQCTDNDIMSRHTEITSRLEKGCNIQEISLEPVEEADIWVQVDCANLQQCVLSNVQLTQLAIDPAKCTVTEGNIPSEMNKVSHFILTIKLSSGRQARSKATVTSSLTSLVDNSTMTCEVEGLGEGQYRIQYTPTVRGHHQLAVSINGQELPASPFSVLVSISPTLLGVPIREWGATKAWGFRNTLKEPYGIAINSLGDVIVADSKNLVTFDIEGRKIRSVACSSSDIATDSEDNIYATEMTSSRIYKFDKDGKLEVQHARHLFGFTAITVVEDEIIASCNLPHGKVLVCNKELEYVRTIKGENMGIFHGISSDTHGNIYCTDPENSCVCVFTKGGEFLYSFGCDNKKGEKLYHPCGICVAGRYVYITNNRHHNVLVFSTGGECVTSFGHHGSGKGEFHGPCGVCVDKNGFVYVCDTANNRIQVF